MDNETGTSAPRRLHRRSDHRMLAGIASGLGDYTGVDPVFFRIGFIVLTLAGGTGVLLYGLGWLLIPEENRVPVSHTLIERIKGRRWLGFVLLSVFALFLLDWIQLGSIDWNVLSAIGLVAIGIVLLRDDPQREPRTPRTATPGARAEAAVAEPAEPKAKRPRSPLGVMTLGVACVAVALGALLNAVGVTSLDLGHYLALVLTIIGIGLVVGARWGRSRLLIALAVLLTPVVLVASVIDVPIRGEITNKYIGVHRPVEDRYEMLVGTMTVDFSEYEFTRSPTVVDISFVAGNVDVFVPPGVHVTVKGEMDLGVADLFGEGFDGTAHEFEHTFRRRGSTEGTLVLNVDGGLGSFDATWARWVEYEKRREMRREERKERREAREKEKGDARDRRRRNRDR